MKDSIKKAFKMGGKSMVFDRGRWKESGNKGSRNEGKKYNPEKGTMTMGDMLREGGKKGPLTQSDIEGMKKRLNKRKAKERIVKGAKALAMPSGKAMKAGAGLGKMMGEKIRKSVKK